MMPPPPSKNVMPPHPKIDACQFIANFLPFILGSFGILLAVFAGDNQLPGCCWIFPRYLATIIISFKGAVFTHFSTNSQSYVCISGIIILPHAVIYRVFIKYCVFFRKFLNISDSGLFPRCQCVYTHQAGRKLALQQN